VVLCVGFRRFACVMRRMMRVTVRRVGVVRGFFVIPRVVVLCRLLMMSGGVFVMLSSLAMMLCSFLRHAFLLSSRRIYQR
jgi:hypothetical protein